MTDPLDIVREQYRAPGLTERLRAALAVFGPEDQFLAPRQLAALDQFHTRGLAATADLARMAGLGDAMSVLDVGCGLGGPARFIAETYGCQVTGVDLSHSFIEAARYLTARTGQSGQVSFKVGSALALPFADRTVDAVLLQHVAMNISDRLRLYGELRRVLKPGGKFATFDIVAGEGEPLYPVPWARNAAASFLLGAEETRAAIRAAGFRPLVWQDDGAAAQLWYRRWRESGPPASPNLGLVMGPDYARLVDTLGHNLLEGRLGVITAVFAT